MEGWEEEEEVKGRGETHIFELRDERQDPSELDVIDLLGDVELSKELSEHLALVGCRVGLSVRILQIFVTMSDAPHLSSKSALRISTAIST